MVTAKLRLVGTLVMLAFLLVACTQAATAPSVAEPTLGTELTPAPTTLKPEGPVLSIALKRGCQPSGSASFANVGLVEGTTAVDFTLRDTRGNEVSLLGLLRDKPVVMVLGSFT